MNTEKIVKERHSVRSYTDKKIEDEKIDEIKKLIEDCNKQGNLNIQLVLNEEKAFNTAMAHYGKFNNVKNYIVLLGSKCNDLDEKCGYFGEKIVLKLQELGLNSCFVGLTYGKNKISYKLKKNEKISCTIAFGYGVNQGVSHEIKSFDEVSVSNKDLPDWYKRGVEYALLAPTAMNQQKFTFELIDNKVKLTRKNGFFSKVDLGIVKYNFELGAGKENFEWYN